MRSRWRLRVAGRTLGFRERDLLREWSWELRKCRVLRRM